MKTYVIEREIPGASQLTHDELRGITSTSNDAVDSLGLAPLHQAQLWDYLERAAHSLLNTFEE